MRKKVLVITTVHPSDDNRIFHREIASIVDKYSVTYYTTDDNSTIKAEAMGVNYVSLGIWNKRIDRLKINYKAFIKSWNNKDYDIVLFHDIEFILYALLIKVFKRKKVIFDMHEDYPGEILDKHWVPKIIRLPVSHMINLAERLIIPLFDGLIVVSQPLLEMKKKNNSKIIVIGNMPTKKLLKKIKKHKKEKKIALLGNLTEIRGAEIVLSALLKLKKDYKINITLMIIGDIVPNNYKKYLRKKYKDIWKNIEITKRLPYEQSLEKASEAKLGLLPYISTKNHDISNPNKIFEYMGLGLPIISTDISNYPSIINECNCGYIYKYNDYNCLAKIIKKAIDADLTIMAQNGVDSFNKKYYWENESEKFIKFISEV